MSVFWPFFIVFGYFSNFLRLFWWELLKNTQTVFPTKGLFQTKLSQNEFSQQSFSQQSFSQNKLFQKSVSEKEYNTMWTMRFKWIPYDKNMTAIPILAAICKNECLLFNKGKVPKNKTKTEGRFLVRKGKVLLVFSQNVWGTFPKTPKNLSCCAI